MKRSGFTLIEVLIAMVILGIGMSSVLAVFYSAASLQRDAYDDVQAAQEIRNVEAKLRGRGIGLSSYEASVSPTWGIEDHSYYADNNYPDLDTDGQVTPLPPVHSGDPALLPYASNTTMEPWQWRLGDRVSPRLSLYPNDYTGSNADDEFEQDTAEVDVLWVPLIQDRNMEADQHDWQVFAFILSRRDQNYAMPSGWTADGIANAGDRPNDDSDFRVPRVLAITGDGIPADPQNDQPPQIENLDHGGYFHVGDRVLIGTGTIARIVGINDDTITIDAPHNAGTGGVAVWFATPPSVGDTSPTRQIISLGKEVVK